MSDIDLFVPPEWAPQSALWVGWPHLVAEWGGTLEPACAEVAGFIRTAAEYAPIRVACGSSDALQSAAQFLGEVSGQVDLVHIPTGDIWLRDTGAIFASRTGRRCALRFAFNGWGGKYVMPGDTETSAAMARHEGGSIVSHDFVLEGGAIELDGTGKLLTTRQCLLHANRNRWHQAQAETALKAAFGVHTILWLDEGLVGDHTDGHIDNLARFVAPGHVLCQTPSGEDDPNVDIYVRAEAALRACGLKVSTLASPGRIVDAEGCVLAASHMNFVLTNGAVILPTYEGVYASQAIKALRKLFPGRDVIGLPANHIVLGGGSFHCMTRECPLF